MGTSTQHGADHTLIKQRAAYGKAAGKNGLVADISADGISWVSTVGSLNGERVFRLIRQTGDEQRPQPMWI